MRVIEWGNPALAIRVLPECGGKIESLRSKRTGREWLWRNPHLPLRHPVYGESYVENLDTGGWDEIFPSVTRCEITLPAGKTLVVPDHGELVGLPWTVDRHEAQVLQLSCVGRAWPFRFVRSLELAGDGFAACYTLVNEHPELSLPWLWCAHPLIAIQPGMTVRWNGADGAVAGEFTVPDPAAPDFQPSAKKMFVTGAASVSVISPDGGESFVFSYLPEEIPVLAFWINYLGWTGGKTPPLFNLGVEPATSASNGLDQAMAAGQHRLIKPGSVSTWHLNLRIL